MRDIESEAAYLREGLWLSALTIEDVIAWADAVILETEIPDDRVLDLALSHDAHPLDVISILESMSSSVKALDVLPCLLSRAHQKLEESPGYAKILVEGLWDLYVRSDYSAPDELKEISWFYDALSLAEQGTYGSVPEVHEQLRTFTARFKDRVNKRF
jgi:hypothetical protein